MNKLMQINDKFKMNDIHGIHGQITFGTGRHEIDYIDPFGNKAKRTVFDHVDYIGENIVPIGAYQWIFNKIFNIGLDQDTTLRVGDLNDEAPQMKIGVPRGRYKSIRYDTETGTDVQPKSGVKIPATNYIFGFMIGDGGAKEDNMTAIAPDYKSRSLFSPIPFRMSNDTYEIVGGKYYGASQAYGTAEPITSYYVKTFDTPAPRIIHSWVTANQNELQIVDDTVFSSTSSLAIESYVEINFSIDAFDTRGYFSSTGSTPRVNEFGLVSGWYNDEEKDWESIRLITHFTRPTIALSDGDSVSGLYRLYAR